MHRTSRLRGALLGGGLGVLAGAIWFALETGGNWAAGGVVSAATLGTFAALDLAVGASAGVLLGALLPQGGLALGLALSTAYAFLRVFEPPGMGAEALFVVVSGAALAAGIWLSRRDGAGVLACVHAILLGAAAVLVTDFALTALHKEGVLRGIRLPVVMALLPLLGVLLDRAIALVVRRRGIRIAVELAVAGIALAVLAKPLSTAPLENRVVTAVPPPKGTPDVFLVSLDTTRADRLSVYGYERPTSPNLAAFAGDAVTFTQARSTAGWTLPGHASMLTGMYPSRHGAHLAGGWLPGQSIDGRRNVAFPLSADKVTLAEALRDRGYSTAGFVANFSYLYRDFGLAQGFQTYEDAPGLLLRVRPPVLRVAQLFAPGFCLKPYRTAHDINHLTLSWLDQTPAGRPVFAFLNYMEPHQPWLAPPPFDQWVWELPQAKRLVTKDLYTHEVKNFSDEELAFIGANYDGQVAAMDAALGELIAALKAKGRYDNALIIVTADHGEMLGEHGFVGHMGRMLYEPLLHVPMVVKYPGAEHQRGRVDTPVQNLDVTPTVLAAAGAAIPPAVQGQPLGEVTRSTLAEEDINPFLVAEYGATYDRAVRVIFEGTWKLITTSHGQRMLFDLANDPGEANDLAATEPARVEDLARRLDAEMSTMVATAEPTKQVN